MTAQFGTGSDSQRSRNSSWVQRSSTWLMAALSLRQASVYASSCVALARKLIVVRPSIVIGDAPACLNPTASLEAVESGVQGPLPDLQRRPPDLMKPVGNCPAVLRLESDSFENEQVESSCGSSSRSEDMLPQLFRFDKKPISALLSKCKRRKNDAGEPRRL